MIVAVKEEEEKRKRPSLVAGALFQEQSIPRSALIDRIEQEPTIKNNSISTVEFVYYSATAIDHFAAGWSVQYWSQPPSRE
jgi:hypothetical protein